MKINSSEISAIIKKRISDFSKNIDKKTEGIITYVADGIIKIYGLPDAKLGELIELPNKTYGLVMNLEYDSISLIVLGDYEDIKEGQSVYCTGKNLKTPVGKELLGRVINALGENIDKDSKIICNNYYNIENEAPGVIYRESVNRPLHTGIKSIDAMIPIGKGQRELIIGDRQTGKTSIALDMILNQKNANVKCIYVSIGQKTSSVAEIVDKLKKHDAMSYTTVVAANASDSVAMQYIAPYTGCAIGEYFRDLGEDALIIYDDLTKHAWAYRHISLLLRRPPGREAYPGDIFYLHSRLLERASQVNELYIKKINKGTPINKTGSLTAIPIIETQSGDISSFIPTNVISITDGQIFLESQLFNAGFRPAINPGNSVSRVGSAAQTNIIKKIGSGIRLLLAQYKELEAFSQFSSELDKTTLFTLKKGQQIMEIIKQKNFSPLKLSEIFISLFTVINGYLEDIKINDISNFENNLHIFINNNYKNFMNKIEQSPIYSTEIENISHSIIKNFKRSYK